MGFWSRDDITPQRGAGMARQARATALQAAAALRGDPVLHTAAQPGGLKVDERAVISVTGSRVTGAVPLATTVPDGAVTAAKIAGGAVGTAALAVGGVGSSNLAAGAVDTAALGAGAVTSAKVTDVGVDKLSGDYAFANRNTGFYGAAAVARPTVPAYTNNLAAPGTVDTQPSFTITGITADDIAALYDAAQRAHTLIARLNNTVVRTLGLGG